NWKPGEFPSGSCNAQPEIMVVAPGRIEPPDLLEDSATHERGRLKDDVVAVAKSVFQVPRARHKIPVDVSAFVDHAGDPVHHVNVRRALETRDDSADGARLPKIVSIQPGENLATAELPAPVDGIERAAIGLGKPANPLAVPLEKVDCPVR